MVAAYIVTILIMVLWWAIARQITKTRYLADRILVAGIILFSVIWVPAYWTTRIGPDYTEVHRVQEPVQTREVREIQDISRKPSLTDSERAARLEELSDWRQRRKEESN